MLTQVLARSGRRLRPSLRPPASTTGAAPRRWAAGGPGRTGKAPMDAGGSLSPKVGPTTVDGGGVRLKSTLSAGAGGAVGVGAAFAPRRLWASYVSALQTSPLRTKLVSAFVIFSSTDVAMQALTWRQHTMASNEAPTATLSHTLRRFLADGYDPVRHPSTSGLAILHAVVSTALSLHARAVRCALRGTHDRMLIGACDLLLC